MALGGEIVVQLRMDDGQFRPAIVKATDMVRAYKDAVGHADTAVQKFENHHDSLGRRFRDIVLTMGNLRFVAMDLNDIFLRLPMAILKSSGELEKMQQLMTGLSTEADRAKAKLEGIRDMNFVIGMAKNAPFEMKALSDAFVKLKTAGIDPANGSMKALVDSIARFGGDGESLRRAGVAIQQMAGKGVISMEELRQQLGEAVPTAMKAMADGMGMSVMELSDKVSKGMVVAGPALRKMLLQMKVENDGAAESMMQTWVGMTSRMKTELTLQAKLIAGESGEGDVGFAKSTKTELGNLLKMMQSDEFKRFGSDFGILLSEIVDNLGAAARFMVKWGDEIKLAAQAFLAFKIVTGIIKPLSDSINSHYKSSADAIRKHNTELTILKDNQRDTLIRQEGAAAASAQAEMKASAERMAVLEKEIAFRRAMAAQLREEMEKAYRPLKNGMTPRDSRWRAIDPEDVRASIRDMSRIENAHVAATARMRSELDQLRESHATSGRAIIAHGTTVDNLTGQLGRLDFATRAVAASKKFMLTAMDLVGGKVGVVLLAIGAMIEAYRYLANAADRAAEAKNRVMNNVATKDDLKGYQGQEKELRDKIALAEVELRSGYTVSADGMSVMPMSKAMRAATQREVDAWKEQLTEISKLRSDAEKSLGDQEIRTALTSFNTGAEREVAKIRAATRDKVRAIEQDQAKVSEALKKGNLTPAQKAANEKEYRKLNDDKNDASIAGLRNLIAYEDKIISESEARRAKYKQGSKAYLTEQAVLEGSDGRKKSLQQELNSALGTRAEAVQLTNPKKKDDKGGSMPLSSPFEDEIGKLKKDEEGLRVAFAGIVSALNEADVAAVAMAEMRAKINNGDFEVKARDENGKLTGGSVKNITEGEKKQLIERAGVVAQLEELVKDMDGFAKKTAQQEPEFQRALAIIADPMGADDQPQVNGFEKLIGRLRTNAGEVEEVATKLNIPADQLQAAVDKIAGVMNRAATIDIAKMVGKEAKENKSLAEQLRAPTNRLARRDMLLAKEREEAASEARALEEARKKVGEGKDAKNAADALEREYTTKSSLRIQKITEDTESPLEKLGRQWADTTTKMEEASAGWAESTSQAFTDLVMTGKADFNGLARSIIADLVKIQIQKAMASAVSSATSLFAFADGGIMTETGSAPLKKYANGGIANSPQLALYGEGSMPEAYVPLPDGRTIPVTMSMASQANAQKAGDSVVINITVNKEGGESSESTGNNANIYRQMGDRIKAVVRDELSLQQRPGGLLYR